MMEDPVSSPATVTTSLTEVKDPPVNGAMETAENGPKETSANDADTSQGGKRTSNRVAKLKEQAHFLSLVKLESTRPPGSPDVSSVSSVESNGPKTPDGANTNDSVLVPANVDVAKLDIPSENIPRFSPSTSAGSTADDESAGSSAEGASSGTSTPGSSASILYNILTSQLQKKLEKDAASNVPKVVVDESVMKKTFKCRHCGRLFLKEYDFKQHERCHMVADEKPFQCPQCGKRFQSNGKLNIHMRVHTGEQPYQCEICKERFIARATMRKHTERCKKSGGLKRKNAVTNLLDGAKNKVAKKSKLSGKAASSAKVATKVAPESGESSKSSDEGGKTYRCTNCYQRFKSRVKYIQHIKIHKEETALEGLHACKKCGKVYERKYNLMKHMKLHDGSAPHACKLCNFRCLRKYTLTMHMEWHRSGKATKAAANRYKCRVCRRAFPQASNLIAHMKSHKPKKEKETVAEPTESSAPVPEWPNVDDRMFPGKKFNANCPHCKKNFVRKFDLLRHIKTHAKNLEHTCKYCDSTFLTKTNYIKHMALHTTKDHHNCRSCGLVYTKKVERHRQEKWCWFRTRQALLGVKREDTTTTSDTTSSDDINHDVETAEYWDVMKPDLITCHFCDLTFSSKSNLYTHVRRHGTGHSCHWCGMVYEKKVQSHDKNFNCWLKTKPYILEKEKDKMKKSGVKPVGKVKPKKTEEPVKMSQIRTKVVASPPVASKDLWRFQCKYCDWAFVDGGNKAVHQRLHEDGGHHTCRWCGLVYQPKKQKHDWNSRCWLTTVDGRLQKAKADKKLLSSPPIGQVPVPETPPPAAASAPPEEAKKKEFQCSKCDRSFDKEGFLTMHMIIHSDVRLYNCTKCNRSFKMKSTLQKHLNNHIFKCHMCLHRFNKEAEFKKHIAKYPHNFKCKNCIRRFVTKTGLRLHQTGCTSDKPMKVTVFTANVSKKVSTAKVSKQASTSAGSPASVSKQASTSAGSPSSDSKHLCCKFCSKAFDRAYSLAIHTRYCHKDKMEKEQMKVSPVTKDGKKVYPCIHCPKVFPFHSQFLRHMESHFAKKYKCHLCGHVTEKALVHRSHLDKVHKAKPFECTQCGRAHRMFNSQKELDAHIETHRNKEGYKCKECGRVFATKFNYMKHLQQHSEASPFHCDKCGVSFLLEYKFQLHNKIYHSQPTITSEFSYSDHSTADSSPEPSSIPSTSKGVGTSKGCGTYVCNLCNRKFKLKGHLVWHQRSCSSKTPSWVKKTSKCRFCLMSFANSARLMIHIQNVHQKKPSPPDLAQSPPDTTEAESQSKTVNGKLQCRKCPRTFTKPGFLKRHEDNYHGAKIKPSIFRCQYCNEKSTRLDFHIAHERLHSQNIYKMQCEVCSVGFKDSEDLEEHMKLHVYGQSFSQEPDDTSVDEQPSAPEKPEPEPPKITKVVRPYACRYCNLGFEKWEFLNRHEKTHAEEARPYSCQHCGMKFRRFTGLTKHESMKHPDQEQSESDGGKPKAGPVVRADDYKETSPNFTCRGCNKEFIRQKMFEIHEKKCMAKRGKVPADYESNGKTRGKGGKAPVDFESNADVTDRAESPAEMPQVGMSSGNVSSAESDAALDLSTKASADEKEKKMEVDDKEGKKPEIGEKERKESEAGVKEKEPEAEAKEMKETEAVGKGKKAEAVEKEKKKAEVVEKGKVGRQAECACTECGQSFKRAINLEMHMRLHTGYNPFQCTQCDETFPRKDYLHRHCSRCHGENDESGNKEEDTNSMETEESKESVEQK